MTREAERTVTIHTPTGPQEIRAGDLVARWVSTGSNGKGVEQADLQELKVVRVNQVTVTVRTKHGSQFRIEPQNLSDVVDWEVYGAEGFDQ